MNDFRTCRSLRVATPINLLGAATAEVVAIVLVGGAILALAEEAKIAPGKFIPSYAVKYGGAAGRPALEDAARFDLFDVSAGGAHAKVYATRDTFEQPDAQRLVTRFDLPSHRGVVLLREGRQVGNEDNP